MEDFRKDYISMCKERVMEAMDRFLHDLSFVPTDKLTWRPTPTAKSALEIAAHCAGYSGNFAWIISAGKFPCSGEEFRSRAESAAESITTREQAEAMLRKGIADTIAALDTVQPEQVDSMIDAPALGRMPFKFMLTLPAAHLESHDGQIDYLQTCYGDLEVHL